MPALTTMPARRPVRQVVALIVTVVGSNLSIQLFSGSLPIYLARDRGFSVGAVGLLVGIAFIPQLIAPIVAGPLVDRHGARLGLRTGAALLLVATAMLLASGDALVIAGCRLAQGLGFALLVPAAYSMVPELVPEKLLGTAMGGFGAFLNVAIAIGPPLGLWLLRQSPEMLFLAAATSAALGFAASLALRSGRGGAPRPGFFTYRRSWSPFLAVTFLTVVYFGVILAYLPISVPAGRSSSVGWFFTADAIGVLAVRFPAGYLTDRFGPRWLLVAGIVITDLSLLLLLLPASLLVLVVAGAGTGAGAALLLPPILVELSKRSDRRNRGTAMALYTSSFAAAIGVGSLAAAPVVDRLGFKVALMLGGALCAVAVPIVLLTVGRPPERDGSAAAEAETGAARR